MIKTDHIFIDGDNPANDWAWARTQEWCRKGDGSYGNPYIIENVTIDCGGTGSGILIHDSRNDYFRIQNCTIFNSGLGVMLSYDGGIKLRETSNGTLYNNTLSSNNGCGISFLALSSKACNLINVTGNKISNNYIGICLDYNSDCNFTGNTVNHNSIGIYANEAVFNNNFLNNTIYNNSFFGISFGHNSIGNVFVNNTIYNNKGDGIDADGDGLNCLIGNTVYNNTGMGIYADGDFNNITGNTVYNNTEYGIVNGGDDAIIANNTIYNNTGFGIWNIGDDASITNNTIENNKQGGINILGDGTTISNHTLKCNGFGIRVEGTGNTITNNTASNNTKYGIYVDGDSNNIAGNTLNNNTMDGIYLHGTCIYNNITDNTANNNENGIYMSSSCDDNIIAYNTVNNNENGIYIAFLCDDNTIANNTANNNSQYGIYLGISSRYNTIANNTVNKNTYGIYLEINCYWNNITNNNANNNTNSGIFLLHGDHYIISYNIANNNSQYGIYLEYGDGNTIVNNTANNNEYGIYLEHGSDTPIVNNIVNNNEYGIYLFLGCARNEIINNTANYNSQHGIYLGVACGANDIINNTVSYNLQYGIYLEDRFNYIYNNTVNYNIYGIFLNIDTNGAQVKGNILIGNIVCIVDAGTNNVISQNYCDSLPQLSNGTVDPKKASEAALFTFTVIYTAADNGAPIYVNVTINSTSYEMSKQDILDNDYTDGCIYNYTTYLATAPHNYTYYFECSDGLLTNTTSIYSDLNVLVNIAPGLTSESLNPKTGDQNTQFTFTVVYTDQNNDAPSYINVVINGTPYAMVKQDSLDNDYTDGCIYNYTITLAPATHNYTYYFECSDRFLSNTTVTYEDLEVMNIAPVLTLGSVDPKKGNQNTQFTFTVNYTDQNNDIPSYINVIINGTVYAMAKQEISDNDYTDGCIYQYIATLAPSAHNYTYYFECSDNYLTDTTGTYDDLEVYQYIAPSEGGGGGGKKTPAAPDFTIPLIIVGISVIAAVGIIIFIMKKRQHRIIE